tara:strand:+ start:76 stop:624 length:549 start_codon:yes stop_codon:yes gene_type:complete
VNNRFQTWFDKKRLGTLFLIGLLTLVGDYSWGLVTQIHAAHQEQHETFEETINSMVNSVTLLLKERSQTLELHEMVRRMYKQSLRIKGNAWVLPGGDDVYAQINVDNDLAVAFKGVTTVRVTNRSRNGGDSIDNTTIDIPVMGFFGRETPEDYLIRLSAGAASRLNMFEQERFYSIILEPVD